MNSDPYLPLYDRLNWDAPRGPIRCDACVNFAGTPQTGAYPSALTHYEEILGPLLVPRSNARILFIFQDPRSTEANFVAAAPQRDGRDLSPHEHRYFCLTTAAWRALRLDVATGSVHPRWPDASTGHHFLRRYLVSSGAWSYDGFLAYFLALLRPTEALITNLAKCHFGGNQSSSVYQRCANVQMSREVDVLSPNLLVSFTSKFTDAFIRKHIGALARLPHLRLIHPAATYEDRISRRDRFASEMARNSAALVALQMDVDSTVARWEKDVAAASLR
jgi:hypothetical protein